MNFSLHREINPDAAAQVFANLAAYNRLHAPDDQHELLQLFLHDEQGQLAGGLLGGTYWGWLVIEILWLRDDARGYGWGSRLLYEAEAEAVRRGCRHAHVDTMDFQAPKFYEKHGYVVWGVLDDLPAGHRRIFYRKDLDALVDCEI